jgi:hypothetical protein
MTIHLNTWPNDADGDVFRKLKSKGFDFSKPYTIDFNIDFDVWPPSTEALSAIKNAFPSARIYEDENKESGYVLFNITALLTYELVTGIQIKASELAKPFGGHCESWGVLH